MWWNQGPSMNRLYCRTVDELVEDANNKDGGQSPDDWFQEDGIMMNTILTTHSVYWIVQRYYLFNNPGLRHILFFKWAVQQGCRRNRAAKISR